MELPTFSQLPLFESTNTCIFMLMLNVLLITYIDKFTNFANYPNNNIGIFNPYKNHTVWPYLFYILHTLISNIFISP